MAIARIASRGRIFYGWYIVAVAAIAGASAGVLGYSFGLFFDPMRESLGWSRTSISWALAIRSAVNMLTGPIYGPIVDRKHGALILMAGGGVVLGVSMMLTAAMTELWQFYCWQSAKVGQIRTREDYYYEELRGSSLRVLL